VNTWLNTSFEMQFRVIDGLTIRFARSEDRSDQALLLSHDIARKIEEEMMYPGQIRVTVIRETRAVDYAK